MSHFSLRPGYALPLLVLAIVLLPGFASPEGICPPGACVPPLTVPDCDVEPGLTAPPDPIQPLDPLDTPILPASAPGVLAAGALPGGGSVDATGEYHYRLPLDVPAGRAGMQPALALAYGSRGKNGHLGAGWAIEGLSEITRCPKTFATEGFSDGPVFGPGDAYCLDGQKLVPLSGFEYRTEEDLFARIYSGGTAGNPAYFDVWTKDGRVRHYTRLPGDGTALVWVVTQESDRSGNGIEYTYGADDPGDDDIFEYEPATIRYTAAFDANGKKTAEGARTVSFEYDAPRSRPDPACTRMKTELDPVFGGGPWSKFLCTTRRLTRITMAVGNEPAWHYNLAYLAPSPGSGDLRLGSVQRCAGAPAGAPKDEKGCLPARIFTWESTRGFTYDEQSFDGPEHVPPPMTADLDGDGRDELVFLQGEGDGSLVLVSTTDPAHPLAQTRTTNVNWSYVGFFDFLNAQPIDLDSDGRTDLVVPLSDAKNHQILSLTNSPSDPVPHFVKTVIGGIPYDPAANTPLAFADLDGDGRPDLARGARDPQNGQWQWSFALNQGGMVPFGPLIAAGPASDTTQPLKVQVGGGWGERNVAFAVDAGQHRANLYVERDAKKFNGFSVDAPPGQPPTAHAESLGGQGPLVTFADLFGEGVRELVAYTASQGFCLYPPVDGGFAYPMGSSDGFPCASFNGADGGGGFLLDNPTEWSLSAADLDGDGKDELILAHLGPNDRKVLFLQGQRIAYTTTDLYGNSKTGYYRAIVGLPSPPDLVTLDALGDFDGDGLLDLAYFRDWKGDSTWKVLRQTGPGTTDRITAVVDEDAPTARETIAYDKAWSPSPDPVSCAYPQRCMRQGFTVVREHDVGQGLAVPAPRKQLYTYEDPRFDVRGRGFLGFGTVRAWDPGRQAETITTYDHATQSGSVYPGALRPKTVRTAVVIDEGKSLARLTQIDTTYQLDLLNQGKTFFVHPKAWTSLEWEEDVTVAPAVDVDGPGAPKVHITGIDGADEHTALRVRTGAYDYDDHGNVKHATLTTIGGVTTEITTTYQNDEGPWLVGLPLTEELRSWGPGMPVPPPRRRAYDYDGRGLLCHAYTEKDDPDPSLPEAVTVYHDAEGLVRAVTTSAAGQPWRTTHLAYDAAERVHRTETWNDLGHATWVLPDPVLGVPLVAEDANGARTRARYDDLGRARRVEPETGGAASIDYAPRLAGWGVVGTTVHVTEDAGGEARTDADELGRVVERAHQGFDGKWIEQATTYDDLGRVATVSRPDVGAPSALVTSYLYDRLDRPLAEIPPAPNETVTHQHSFFVTQTWDPLGHETDVERDLDDRPIHSIELLNGQPRTTTFAYGPFDQLGLVTTPDLQTVAMHYDRRGRRDALSDPDAGLSVFAYDGFGELVKRTASGDVTFYQYDVLGRRVQASDPEGLTTYTWDTAPNGRGALAHTQSVDGTAQDFSYDSLGRLDTLTTTVDGKPYAFTPAYDKHGRLASLAYPAVPGRPRFTVGRTYNKASGYLQSVRDASLGADPLSPGYLHVQGRNADDRLLTATLGNGMAVDRTYYDDTGRLWTLTEGTALALSYSYDFDGQVQLKGDLNAIRSEHYGYDDLHRLTSWTLDGHGETDYHYDDRGNLHEVDFKGALQETYSYGPRPHVLHQGPAGHYQHDARGREHMAPGRTTTYTDFDLPRTLTTPAGVTSFAYDAGGARVKKTNPDGSSVITLGGLYERRADPNGHVVHVFYVPGEDGPVAQVVVDEQAKSPVTEYLHPDPLGSVSAVSDAKGHLTEPLYYEPFGARVQTDGSPLSGALPGDVRRSFAGHRHDDELGLVDMRGRVYEPATRRFLTPDPHVTSPGRSQSYDRYGYVLQNPTNLTDPSGFDCFGWECVGDTLAGGNWTSDPIGFSWGLGGPSGAGAGSSAPKLALGPCPLLSSEDRRPIGIPGAPGSGAPISGPRPTRPGGIDAATIDVGPPPSIVAQIDQAVAAVVGRLGPFAPPLLGGWHTGQQSEGPIRRWLSGTPGDHTDAIPAVANVAMAALPLAELAAPGSLGTGLPIVPGEAAPAARVGGRLGEAIGEALATDAAGTGTTSRALSASYSVNPTGCTTNCANVARALDATLAGSPASAIPGEVTPALQLAEELGRPFKYTLGAGEIVRTMESAGPAARGIVFGQYAGKPGHFFNVVNEDGKVLFLDGQLGGAATTSGYDSLWLLRTN